MTNETIVLFLQRSGLVSCSAAILQCKRSLALMAADSRIGCKKKKKPTAFVIGFHFGIIVYFFSCLSESVAYWLAGSSARVLLKNSLALAVSVLA